jgi:hypothetical protein
MKKINKIYCKTCKEAGITSELIKGKCEFCEEIGRK